jgi:hypothetical protein
MSKVFTFARANSYLYTISPTITHEQKNTHTRHTDKRIHTTQQKLLPKACYLRKAGVGTAPLTFVRAKIIYRNKHILRRRLIHTNSFYTRNPVLMKSVCLNKILSYEPLVRNSGANPASYTSPSQN